MGHPTSLARVVTERKAVQHRLHRQAYLLSLSVAIALGYAETTNRDEIFDAIDKLTTNKQQRYARSLWLSRHRH